MQRLIRRTSGNETQAKPIKNPAMVALIRLESVAAASARKPSWAISGARFGEIAENAPTTTPIEPKLANPQRANEIMAMVLTSSVPLVCR